MSIHPNIGVVLLRPLCSAILVVFVCLYFLFDCISIIVLGIIFSLLLPWLFVSASMFCDLVFGGRFFFLLYFKRYGWVSFGFPFYFILILCFFL